MLRSRSTGFPLPSLLCCALDCPRVPLQPVLRYDAGRGPITALALTPEGCFLAGEAREQQLLVNGRCGCCDYWTSSLELACQPAVGLRNVRLGGTQPCMPKSTPCPPHRPCAAGTTEGSLVLFAPDPRRRITRRFNLAA